MNSYEFGAQTTYYLNVAALNSMPIGSSFIIAYPNSVSFESALSQCTLTINDLIYPMTCTHDPSIRTIYATSTTLVVSTYT
jgi:hypothetical protein